MIRNVILRLKTVNFIAIVALAAFLTLPGVDQAFAESLAAPAVHWEVYYGGEGADTAYSVVESTYDNSYVFAGATENERKVYAVKVDKTGATVWSKSFGGGYYTNVARAVYKTADEGFILAGYSRALWYLGNDRIYLVKIDGQGNLEWEKRIFVADGKAKAKAFAVQQTSDGGYIVAGSALLGDQTDMYVCKTDAAGEVQWEQYFGGTGWDSAYAVQQTRDQGYVVAGSIEAGRRNVALIKLDQAGGIMWQQNFISSAASDTQAKSVKQTLDSGFILTGYNGNNINLIKTDAGGRKLWEKTFDGGIGYGVDEAADGGYILTGRNGSAGIMLIRTDKSGNKVWEQTLGTAGAIGFSVKYTQDDRLLVTGESAGNAYLAVLQPEREAVLEVSSPNVLQNRKVLVFTALKEGTELITTGTADVKIKIPATNEEIVLKDGGADGDMSARDGIYSAWYTVTEAHTVDIELYISDSKVDSTSIKVITRPNLVVLTDFKNLWDEFIETGMAAQDDNDDNNKPDYYDLVGRLSGYAYAHDGVVLDLSQEITVAAGYAKDYKTMNYFGADAYDMGIYIDGLVNEIGIATQFKNIAIIGDDRVVPFFRRNDPTATVDEGEHTYPPSVGGHQGNTTLGNTSWKKIMTDVPYGSYDNTDPNTVSRPRLDAGVGRVFADRPDKLVDIIDAYEGTIVLNPENRTAVLYSLKRDHVDWPAAVNAGVLPVLNNQMQGGTRVLDLNAPVLPYTPGNYYNYDGTVVNWTADNVTTAINNADITMYWSHADHKTELTQNNPDLTSASLDGMEEAPGHVLINTGCHSGYSVSQSGTNASLYQDTLAASLMEKKVTYMAPTTYGYGAEPRLGYHDLILSRFLENLLNGTSSTIGQAQVASYGEYWANVLPGLSNNLSTYCTYGTILYGLPTQAIEHGGSAVPAPAPGPGPAPAPARPMRAMSSAQAEVQSENVTMNIPVEIPNFKVSVDTKGKSLIEIPNGGTQTLADFAPSLPLITKSYFLPYGAQVTNVKITDTAASVYTEPLDLQLTIPINRTHGPAEGSFQIPNPYPDKLFWWDTTEQNGGTLLTISIIPAQYDPETKLATLFNKLDFQVDYTTTESTTTIDAITLNGGGDIVTGSETVPVSIAVYSPGEQTVGLLWTIKDPAGHTVKSGTQQVSLIIGSNTVDFSFNTEGWTAGPKDLSVAIFDNAVRATRAVQFTVNGIDAIASLNKTTFSPVDTSGYVTAEVRDERGALIGGLTSARFTLSLSDQGMANQTFEEISPGIYKITFGITNLEPGVYPFLMEVQDDRGATKSCSLYLRYKDDAAPPGVVSTVPADQAQGVQVDADVVVKYDEAITQGSAFNKITLKSGGETVKYTARFSGSEFVLMPDNDLSSNTLYSLHIPVGAVEDLSWNPTDTEHNFTFKTLPNSNAYLSDIKLGGASVAGFTYSRYTYNVTLPYGTVDVPPVTVTPEYSKAVVEITPAPHVRGTADIKVTAEDGTTTQTYTLQFSVVKNTDASLQELKVAGETAAGFETGKTACFFVLPYGTTEVPALTALANDSNATVQITPADSVNGTAAIRVTAEDGTTQKTYTVKFSVARNSDAFLKELQVDGQAVTGFAKDKFAYKVELAEGTTQAPQVMAIANDSGSWVETNQAPAIPGSAVVVVTAANGTTTKLYTVTFGLAGGSDTGLQDLKVDGLTIPGFSADRLTYEYVLPYGATQVPVVSGEATDVDATVVVTQADGSQGTATIAVTSQDSRNNRTYSVIFRVLESNGALLRDLQVDGTTVTDFSGGTLNYEVILPSGTTTIPQVTADAVDVNGRVTITQAEQVTGSAVVTVVSQDGKNTAVYSVTFDVVTSPSATASLADLLVNGESLQDFAADRLNYQVVLPAGLSEVPLVEAYPADPQANVVITQPENVNGTARILVTSSDGRTTKIYTVSFKFAENTSASLSDLRVSGTTITGFSGDTLNYQVLLPAGTAKLPQVTAVTLDPGARVVITMPEDLTGIVTVKVTSPDGRVTQSYHVSFRVIQTSVASLSDLNVDDNTILGFTANKLNYEMLLPYGTTRVPWITASPTDPAAKVSLNQAENVNGIATVVVTSADGRLTRTYSVFFTEAKKPNADATLRDLRVGGTTITGFTYDLLSYNLVLPHDTTVVPVITATTTDESATIVITQADSVTGTARVVVTAEDGTTTKTYTITFSLAPSPDGGGGGGGIPTDTSGPVVVSTIPAEKHPKDVNTNTPIHIKFDEQIQPGSKLSDITFKAGTVPIQFSYKIDGVVLKLIPVNALKPGTTYEILIPAAAVKDGSGNSLPNPYSFGFTTGVIGPIANPFTDVTKDHWAVNEIVYLYNKGIITGFPDSTFKPGKEITRGQLATIVARTLKLDINSPPTQQTFADVSKTHWAYKEIEATMRTGVMVGYGNGMFKPDIFIAREELVKVIINALHYQGGANSNVSEDILSIFDDQTKIPKWARQQVAEAVERGIVKGISPKVFGAGIYGTREQVCVLLYQLSVIK